MIIAETLRALGYLLVSGVVFFAWKQGRDSAKGGKLQTALSKGFLWCAGLALLSSIMLGNPACEQTADPVYGGCEQYADNGYERSDEQRIANFIYLMTLLYLPVVFGAFKGSRE